MKTQWSVALVLTLIFVAGCASEKTGGSSNMVWYQSGVSGEQARRDFAACQNEALVNGQSYSPIPADTVGHAILLGMLASSSESGRENEIVRTCMVAKGYQLVSKDQIPNDSTIGIPNSIESTEAEAESGDAIAQYNLGIHYVRGDGVETNLVEAVKWFRLAADKGYAAAQYKLGYSYYKGYGIVENEAEAVNWFRKAAGQNFALAQFGLGECYANGRGVQKDEVEACKWYSLAAAQGDQFVIAYCEMGSLHYNLHKFTDALADFRKSCELDTKNQDYPYFYLYIWLIRARLGEQADATQELQTYLDNRNTGTADNWPSKIALLFIGKLTEPDFFKAAENTDKKIDNGQHCEAYFYAGTKRLIEGDKNTATDYFEKCLSTGCNDFGEYSSAMAELKILKPSQ